MTRLLALLPVLSLLAPFATPEAVAAQPCGDDRAGAASACRTGVASWYGQHYQGRKTASGEAFDDRSDGALQALGEADTVESEGNGRRSFDGHRVLRQRGGRFHGGFGHPSIIAVSPCRCGFVPGWSLESTSR